PIAQSPAGAARVCTIFPSSMETSAMHAFTRCSIVALPKKKKTPGARGLFENCRTIRRSISAEAAEPVVQLRPDDVRGIVEARHAGVGEEPRAGCKGYVGGAEVDEQIFRANRPVRSERELDAGTGGPANLRVTDTQAPASQGARHE